MFQFDLSVVYRIQPDEDADEADDDRIGIGMEHLPRAALIQGDTSGRSKASGHSDK